MRTLLTLTVLGILAFSSVSGIPARAEEALSLNTYLCDEFVVDAAHPNTAEKLLRTMMMVSWAAGFAAAHQEADHPRADKAALKEIGATLRTICTEKRHELVIQAFARAVDNFVKAQGLSKHLKPPTMRTPQ